jgi:transglutaminase-like putative cysteine protease
MLAKAVKRRTRRSAPYVIKKPKVSEGACTRYDPTANSSEVETMQIRLGYELVYDCPQPTPMLLMLNVHYTRISNMVVPDHLVISPSIPIRAYRDGFGNWCGRIVAPTGRTRYRLTAS